MVTLDIDPTEALRDLELAKAQLVIRVSQLSSCRVCGADLLRFEQALGTVRAIITQLEPHNGIRPREEQPQPPRDR